MKRTRIVLDTNVLISAILFGGLPRRVLEKVISGEIDCTLSFAILDELRDVLQRSKFGFSPEQTIAIIDELHAICEIVNPARRIRTIKADPDDNRILECAIEARWPSLSPEIPICSILANTEAFSLQAPQTSYPSVSSSHGHDNNHPG